MGKGCGRIKRRQQQLEQRKDPLIELNRLIPWEMFLSCLEQVHPKERKSNAGRKPIDLLLLFKLLILQQLYNLSPDELEYQVHDRNSFRRFLGLSADDEVPDATTISKFEDRLSEVGLIDELFEKFEGYLRECGYEAKGGQIVDATIIPVPIQRNSREERTSRSNTARFPQSGRQIPINYLKKTPMRAGSKRTTKVTSATRPTSTLMLSMVLSALKALQMLQCTTLRSFALS